MLVQFANRLSACQPVFGYVLFIGVVGSWYVAPCGNHALGQVAGAHANTEPWQNLHRSITVEVTESIPLQPRAIQWSMNFKSESRDLKEALAKLREHQANVEQECVRLGAAPKSIRFTSPVISTVTPGVENVEMAKRAMKIQAAQMQANNPNMRNRLRSMLMGDEEDEDAEEEEQAELPTVFNASSKLTAVWELANGMDEEAVLLSGKLRAAMQDKVFRIQQKKVVLTEEEMDLIQPLISASAYYGYSFSNRGEQESPIQFIAQIGPEQEEAALKRAVERATAQANRLAKAAGKQKIEMRHLSSALSPTGSAHSNLDPSEPTGETIRYDVGEQRIVSTNPNDMSATLSVRVIYELID